MLIVVSCYFYCNSSILSYPIEYIRKQILDLERSHLPKGLWATFKQNDHLKNYYNFLSATGSDYRMHLYPTRPVFFHKQNQGKSLIRL
jgi:hypothetical protein